MVSIFSIFRINWSSHSSFPGHLVPWLVPANYSSLKRLNTFTFPSRHTTRHEPRLHHSNSPSIIPSSEQHQLAVCPLELATNLRKDFTITGKAPIRAFSWLKVPTRAFTFKTLLGHYAKHKLSYNGLMAFVPASQFHIYLDWVNIRYSILT